MQVLVRSKKDKKLFRHIIDLDGSRASNLHRIQPTAPGWSFRPQVLSFFPRVQTSTPSLPCPFVYCSCSFCHCLSLVDVSFVTVFITTLAAGIHTIPLTTLYSCSTLTNISNCQFKMSWTVLLICGLWLVTLLLYWLDPNECITPLTSGVAGTAAAYDHGDRSHWCKTDLSGHKNR